MAISTTKRQKVYAAYGNRCVICDSDEWLTIDHLTPLSKGGTDKFDNLAPMCNKCNNKKGDSILEPEQLEAIHSKCSIAIRKNKKAPTEKTYTEFRAIVLAELNSNKPDRHLCYWEKYPLAPNQKVWEYERDNPESCAHRAILQPITAYRDEPAIVGLTKRDNGFNGFRKIKKGNPIYQHRDYLYLKQFHLVTNEMSIVKYNLENIAGL